MPKGIKGFQKGNVTRTQFKNGHKFSAETIAKLSEFNKGKTLSTEHKARISASQQGREGTVKTAEHREKIRQSHLRRWDIIGRKHNATTERVKDSNYIIWRTAVFQQDHYTCQVCDQVGYKLEAHHIKDFISYPRERYNIANGLTLCKRCHANTDNYKRRRPKPESCKVIFEESNK